ncbi:unnamed protein product [Mytilus edulis]|uniref:WSC domain-containing protein n=1 Tax=Mytilus edulis TaxID=6550 RepID=A0A8S3R1K0_MYTED|nr:unnamed protein product [Mytilus edulis]
MKRAGSNDYVRCFIDTNTRQLPHQYLLNNGDLPPDMENNTCLLYCKEQGYMYSGTENANQCFCGDDPYQYGPENVNDEYIQDFDCDRECTGDSKQMCGGGWRLTVYETGYLPFEEGCNKQRQIKLKLVSNNTMLTAPANQVLTSRSKIECAQYCKISDNCKVFVISTETRECSLYNSFTVMCEGVQTVQGFQVYMMK